MLVSVSALHNMSTELLLSWVVILLRLFQQLLVAKGANAATSNRRGVTALSLAQKRGCESIIQFLQDPGDVYAILHNSRP